MAHNSGSKKAVLFALGANFGIAVAKTLAAFFTGSGAMLAEALHSFADCGNQVLLLMGMKVSQRPPSENHPMGYGKAAYLFAMLVAVLLFSVGGLFSITHGVQGLSEPKPVQYLVPSIIVLLIAAALEGSALRGALAVVRTESKGKSLFAWFRSTRQSELLVVVGEDIAALGGLVLALLALIMTAITGNSMWDAVGSIAVGTLLVITAVLVLVEVTSLVMGESVSPAVRRDIKAFLEAQPEVSEVINMITEQHGTYMMVAVKVRMSDALMSGTGKDLVKAVNDVEERMQANFTSPELRYSFFEPDLGQKT